MKNTCTSLVMAIALVAVSCSAPSSTADHEYSEPPNFLLITIECTSASNLGCYGYPRPVSPNIDKVADEGVLFERAFAGGDCTPISLPTILTGVNPSSHCMYGFSSCVPDHLPTIFEILSGAGYETFAGGESATTLKRMGMVRGVKHLIDDSWWGDFQVPADTLNREALRFIEATRPRPFIAWLHYIEPHAPYAPPLYYWAPFSSDSIFANDDRVLTTEDLSGYSTEDRVFGYCAGSNRHRDYIAAHDGEVFFIDSKIRELLQDLERFDVQGNTVVLITADHGEIMDGDGPLFTHGVGPRETLLHVPMILRLPDRPPTPSRITANVGHVDILPTILKLAGESIPEYMAGRDLIPLINGVGMEDRILQSASCSSQLALRLGTTKHVGRPGPEGWETSTVVVGPNNRETRASPYDSQNPGGQSSLIEAASSYFSDWEKCLVAPATEISAEEQMRLRALGYLK